MKYLPEMKLFEFLKLINCQTVQKFSPDETFTTSCYTRNYKLKLRTKLVLVNGVYTKSRCKNNQQSAVLKRINRNVDTSVYKASAKQRRRVTFDLNDSTKKSEECSRFQTSQISAHTRLDEVKRSRVSRKRSVSGYNQRKQNVYVSTTVPAETLTVTCMVNILDLVAFYFEHVSRKSSKTSSHFLLSLILFLVSTKCDAEAKYSI